ncbi:MAG TPA: THUMP domain-containing protein [Nitrososphaeraceae archaeon]|nr:THUMP domain-containing protein [Nitrososphaeraceae archaeon]
MTTIRFNIIASTFKYGEEDAQQELLGLLELLGDHHPYAEITNINGIIVAYTNLSPFRIIDLIRRLVIDEPWQVRYILRLIPMELMVSTKLGDIANAVKSLTPKMHSHDTFRITVEKRHSVLSTDDIIATLASKIDNRVQLKSPDWIVLVEIIGAFTGVSILKQDQIFRSVIEKRNSSSYYNNSNFGYNDTTM